MSAASRKAAVFCRERPASWRALFAPHLSVNQEDSGVIDLFAIHQRASSAPPTALPPSDLLSSPPPAFTLDLAEDDAHPFASKPRKKLMVLASAAGVLLFAGILVASLSGGTSAKAAAGSPTPDKIESAPQPVVAIPRPAAPAIAAEPAPAATPPAPPATGASAETRPPLPTANIRNPAPKSRHQTSSGVRLVKVQSAGVPSP